MPKRCSDAFHPATRLARFAVLLAVFVASCDDLGVGNFTDLGNTGGGRPPSAVINTNNPQGQGGGALYLTLGNEGASVGMPVVADFPEDTLLALPARANALGTSEVAGVVTSVVDGVVTVQNTGIVELTVDEWAAITGLTGIGLNEGNVYYVSSASAGLLVSTRPVTAGTYQARVGLAISATQLLLMLSVPVGPHT